MRATLAFLFLFVVTWLPSCGTVLPADPLRVSTETERADAEAWITTAETALTAARLTGVVNDVQFNAGLATIAELRRLVADSATTPTRWATLLQRAINLAGQIIPVKSPPPAPTP